MHLEVAVAPLPRGHLVAVDRVHVDVDREQVVAALGAVVDDVVEEVPRGQALALKASLHVGERQQDGVYLPGVNLRPQLVEFHRASSVHLFVDCRKRRGCEGIGTRP